MSIGIGIGMPSQRVNPYLFNGDFSVFSGSVAQIAGSFFSCASANRTVQTSETAVVTGIPADNLPVGRVLNSMPNCLSFDGPSLNEMPYQIEGFVTGTAIISAEFDPSGMPCKSVEDSSNTAFMFRSAQAVSATPNVQCLVQLWLKPITFSDALYNTFYIRRGNPLASNNSSYYAAFKHALMPSGWRRYVGSIPISGYTTTVISVFPAVGLPESVVRMAKTGMAFCTMSLQTLIPTEFFQGDLAGSTYRIDAPLAIYHGTLGLELDMYQKASSAAYGTVYIWYIDADNCCTYNGVTSKITVTIGGVSYSPPELLSWDAPVYTGGETANTGYLTAINRVRLFIRCGATQTLIYARVNNDPTIVFTPSSSQGALAVAPLYAACQSDPSNGQFSGHYAKIRTCTDTHLPGWR